MLYDYADFVNDGFESQQKYDEAVGNLGPIDLYNAENLASTGLTQLQEETLEYRYSKVIEHLGHLVEETIEARMCVPRRSWKKSEASYLDNSDLRHEFIAEMFDILLFHRAVLAYAGIRGEEFVAVALEKYSFNMSRKDHNVNDSPGTPNNNYDRD